MTQPGLAVSGVGLPNDIKPFTDKRVRQALNHAVDFDAIDKSLFQGLAVPMTSPLAGEPMGLRQVDPGLPLRSRPGEEDARGRGLEAALKVEFLTYNSPRGYNPAGPDLAVAIQGYLRQDRRRGRCPQSRTWARTSPPSAPANTQGMFMVGWTGDNGDPDNFVGELFNSSRIPVTNTPRYKNPEVDKLLDRGGARERSAKAPRALQRHPEEDPRRCALDLRQLGVAGARDSQGGQGLRQLNPTQMFFDMEKVSLEK